MIWANPGETPFDRGFREGYSESVSTPAVPKGNASWAEKLYARGFTAGRLRKAADADENSFVEETCNCGRVWRGTPGSNPSSACPDCGEQMAAEHKWRRENHHP